MSLSDKLGGKAKEAAGEAIGDDQLRAEGKADQLAAKVKDAATEVIDKVKNIVQK
ncbi:CsbD-like [Amycolatopsis xylanica]|uniref:CsbD-like n=1 Tax=Amycolatopsis xylanica TaxID=589385 RepID=A0A1H2V3S6_9PSEU|nr:CsbD family protein [Amycolatopsis xylanica]SDW62996.1 CsbD-like [Amycolatopsis xylanica]